MRPSGMGVPSRALISFIYCPLVGGGGSHPIGPSAPQACPCGCAVTLSTKFMEQYTKLETQLLLLQKYVLGKTKGI